MNVSIAIQAHPSRGGYVDELREVLGDVPVAWAEEPFATAEDRRPVWRTKRAALLMHTDAPFHAVIQDDAVPGRKFKKRLERLVEAGDFLYMLFFRQKRDYPDVNALAIASIEQGWFTTKRLVLGPGLVVPTHRIADLVEFADRVEGLEGDDHRMKAWVKARDIETYVPLPSLVNHRGDVSTVGRRIPGRRAWLFR